VTEIRSNQYLAAYLIVAMCAYTLISGPLFVYCLGASGHRQIEPFTPAAGATGVALESDQLSSPAFTWISPSNVNDCGDCVDVDLLLPSNLRDHPSSTISPDLVLDGVYHHSSTGLILHLRSQIASAFFADTACAQVTAQRLTLRI